MVTKRIVALPDIHVPYNIELEPVFSFIEDFKPDAVILLGDVCDWTSCSHWVADQSVGLSSGSIYEDYERLRGVVLDPIKKAVEKECKIVYLEGNHELWLWMAIAQNKDGRGYWEFDKNIDFKKYNMTYLNYNVPYKASKHLYYMHGTYTNEFHSKKTVMSYQRTIIYGHTHDVQEYTLVSPLDTHQVHKAKSIGCLCTRNPNYLKNAPNRWVHAFNYAYIEQDGTFNEYTVNVINDKFWANGKKYH